MALTGRLLLAAVFLVAGTLKLWDRTGTRESLAAFGAPRRLLGALTIALPLAELAVGLLLLPSWTTQWASYGACALLLLFSSAIIDQLVRGRRPACRCFGQLVAGPVGASTLVRNGVLLAVAGAVAWSATYAPPRSFLAIIEGSSALEGGLIVGMAVISGCFVAVAALLVQLVGQQSRLLMRVDDLERQVGALSGRPDHAHGGGARADGLPVGSTAPSFTLPSVTDETHTLASFLARRVPVAMIFTDPQCGPCMSLLPDIGRWQQSLAAQISVVIVGRGSRDANRAHAVEHDVNPLLLQAEDEVADAYRVFATPAAVIVRPDGTVGSRVAAGPEQIRSLMMHALAFEVDKVWTPPLSLPMVDQPDRADTPGGRTSSDQDVAIQADSLPIGAAAPDFRLPDLSGAEVDLEDLRGQATLVIFWSPDCAFCHQMLPVLRAWEANRPDDSPQLLIVTDGSPDANRQLGLVSRMVLDSTLAVGEAFGARGTPSAVLLDADGKIVSALAVGAVAVLPLLGVAHSVSATTSLGDVPMS